MSATNIPQALSDGLELGYRRGMRHETVVAARWGSPLAEYVNVMQASGIMPSTVQMRSYQIRVLSRGFLDVSPWAVTGLELTEFLARHETWGLAAKRSARAAYRGFFGWAVEAGHIVMNPALSLRKVKSPQGRPRPAPKAAVAAAINAADPRTRMMIYLGASAGLRRSEISRVHTDDLIVDQGDYSLVVLGKGGKTRIVPLIGALSGWLLTLRDERGRGWAFPSVHRGYESTDYTTAHLSVDRVGKLITATLPDGITPHMLRHRFATDFYVATGNDLLSVREALGHSSVATTQVYTEIPRSALRRGMDNMDLLG